MDEEQCEKYTIDIDDYNLVSTISRTKHSTILVVKNKSTGRKFAAKTNLNKTKSLSDLEKQFIWGELCFLIRVQHPIFLKFHGFSFKDFYNNNNMTILMDYIPGGSLSNIIDEEEHGNHLENFDNTRKQIILVGISCGMMILHRHHILHRDLKPENIQIDENYEPRISDVALTKFFDPLNTSRSDYPSFTYMAPEVIKYNNFNPKSDVYSFGIIMYEVIMGCRCYSKIMAKKNYSASQLKAKILKGLRPEFNVPIKRGLQRLIERCWSKDPCERPTFSELYNKLSLLAEEFDGEFHERFDERELNEHKYCLDDVDASKIINYISEINDETDEATKLRTEIRKLKTEVSNLNETILDQSAEIKMKDDEIKKMEEKMKIQTDQFKEKIEVEHSEVKYMREFLLEHVRNQFIESKAHSSAIKLLVSIDEIFNDTNIYALFKEFCQEKLSPEYIYYIEDMAAYYNMKEDCKPLLFFDFRDKYFKEGAPNFLNIQLSVIKEINNAKEPSPELLDKVLRLVYDICKVQLIREFKYSSKYIEYTSNSKNHRKRLSKKYN